MFNPLRYLRQRQRVRLDRMMLENQEERERRLLQPKLAPFKLLLGRPLRPHRNGHKGLSWPFLRAIEREGETRSGKGT